MIDIFLSIAPIFLLLVLGYVLRRGGIPSVEFWNLNDRLVYWILFPALLFSNTSTFDLSGDLLSAFAVAIYCGFGSAVIFALLSSRLFRLDGPTASSVLQGSARHNSFIALAVAERLIGFDGLALATLVTALLIPVTNITVVTLMVTMIRGDGGRAAVMRAVLRDLARNPLLIAVGLGIGANVLNIAPIPVVSDMAKILGAAALPIMLLCVGANIRIRAMTSAGLPVLLSVVGKMVVFPAMILVAAQFVDLSDAALLVLILYGAVPTAASAYTLARQMGGNAPVMATIITLQTAISFVTLPITVTLVQWLGAK
ncbi:MAG: AEC family transporter [Caldilinea sp.]|nr:AEC family transporter [Caldilineaceae bacterium]MCO5208785.1 AEC family transporter [Caldilinea sp.]MCB0068344.1 AEC family transporter [Caldilineaceae bacterium]MCB9116295.1 AEC family transporter [Caldilineaceae bacterium]MCB9122138.1 AEC family transporter [Caldilineaceae bacterium]